MVVRSGFVLLLLLLAGCSSTSQQASTSPPTQIDPLESVNRGIWDLNWEYLDPYLLKPVTEAYDAVVPRVVRTRLVNVIENLDEPLHAANNLMQGKFESGLVSVGRFGVNSTVGVFGVFEVANELGWQRAEEDFNQTLAVWGIGSGPFLMLPAAGPSDTRNLASRFLDNMVYPWTVLAGSPLVLTGVISALEGRSALIGQEQNIDSAIDPYVVVKDAYWQRNLSEIYDGEVPVTANQQQDEEDFSAFEDLLDNTDQ